MKIYQSVTSQSFRVFNLISVHKTADKGSFCSFLLVLTSQSTSATRYNMSLQYSQPVNCTF